MSERTATSAPPEVDRVAASRAAVLGDPVGGELAQAPALQPAEPAESLRGGDLQLVHDARALGLPDR
ncbi:MAG TPA: hypothetical protein VFS72_14730, partial [Agromyces sp.]|nr:hypothetical protein [Agromyces sp.]